MYGYYKYYAITFAGFFTSFSNGMWLLLRQWKGGYNYVLLS